MMNDRLISLNAAKDYIDSQKGRPFIGCTVGEAMKIMLDEVPSAQPEQPAQDYMRTVMKKVKEKYEEAVNTHYIMNPMAWALYQVWKEYDHNG